MNKAVYEGQCHCGAIGFRLAGEPGACHTTAIISCRPAARNFGGPFARSSSAATRLSSGQYVSNSSAATAYGGPSTTS